MFDPSKNINNIISKSEFNDFKRGTGVGDFLNIFQDPTSLGFKLFFINIGDNGERPKNKIEISPKSIYDLATRSAGSNEGSQTDTINVVNSTGLFGNKDNPNSALYYLHSIGDFARYDMLVDFKKLLSRLNTEFPWYFQSIDGLNDAWNRDYKVAKFHKELTITCLESIDLRITALMDLYRKIAYDWNYRRAILPDNLRKFELSIKIYDVRNFQRDPGRFGKITSQLTGNKNTVNREFLGEDYSVTNQITFNLSNCEFLPDESGSILSTVSNSSYENTGQHIKIGYESIEEDNIYRSLVALGNSSHYYVRDYLQKEREAISSYDPTVFNSVFGVTIPDLPGINSSNYSGFIQDVATNITSQAAGTIASKLNSLFLGNVYGFSPITFGTTLRNKLATAPGNKVRDLGNTFGKGKN